MASSTPSGTATARDVAPGPTWLLLEADQPGQGSHSMSPGVRLVAGRGSAVDLTLRDPGVSRRHFEIENLGDRLTIRDLGSKGGTFVNGRQVSESVLAPGDYIEAGSSRMVAVRLQALIPRIEKGAMEVVRYSSGSPGGRVVLDRPVIVGRSPECDLVVADARVSRRHIEIRPEGAGALVVDLAPSNRTDINGRRLSTTRTVSPGDRIALADLDEVLVLEAPQATSKPIAVELSDGRGGSFAVEVDAGLNSTVADVAERLVEFTGQPRTAGAVWTLLQPESGMVLHPENRWVDAGVRRGDRLVLLGLAETPPGSEQAVRFGAPRVTLNQLPRAVTPPGSHRVRTPRPPESQSLRGRGVSWQILGGLGIIFAGIMMVFVNPNYAPFAVIGGVVGIVSVGSGIMGEQSRRKHGVHAFREKLVLLDDELLRVRGEQAQQLHEMNPSPTEVDRWISERSRRLWERRPADTDFLRLRVGLGTRRALIESDDQASTGDSPLQADVRAVLDRHRFIEHVPVLLPPPGRAPVVGVVGSRRDVLEVCSWLLIQAATLHSPAELKMLIPAVNQDWMWARWLPHLEAADGVDLTWNETDAGVLARKLAAAVGDGDGPTGLARSRVPQRLVIVPHGASDLLADVMVRDSNGETLYLVLADYASDLPNRIDAVLTVNGETATIEGPDDDGLVGAVSVDRMSHEAAGAAARVLGRYEDARKPPRAASGQLGLLDLLGIGGPEDVDVGALWTSGPYAPLSAVVGTTLDENPLVLGFRSDGVHGVVGGTTGSGKSEFLQTLLVSLALTHRPDQLNFFLIDFKGGATFAALSDLPHVAGVVTDLEKDATLANRAFTSLEAEMARRKAILDRARVPGLIEYERLPEAASKPLPALLVVIDEFALLVRQQPEVKERLDLVATQGRSLGVHLLLATQSPANVITPSIRSNTQVWIGLRVVDDSESTELLGHRDAARIPTDRPGRGFVRFGGSQTITGFQTARIARPVGEAAQTAGVSVRPFADLAPAGGPASTRPVEASGRVVTELELVCDAVGSQCRALGVRAADRLWLDPLPEMLPAPDPAAAPREPGHLVAAVGLRDDPAKHVQDDYAVDVGLAGNVLVVGTRGSGKSNTVKQVVLDLVGQYPPAELHVYGVESGTGSLNPLARLPHTAAVVPAGDKERLYRVFSRLTRLMDERRDDLAVSGFADFGSWRRGSAQPEAWIVLVIDDYPAFKEVADGSSLGLLNDQLLSLCQGGPSVGIHVILTSSQSGDLRINLINLFGERILLRQVDAADYALLDLRLRPGEVPPSLPGRALVAGGLELQVFHSPDERADSVARTWHAGTGGPEPIRRLPVEIPLIDLPVRGPGHAIGVRGPEFHPLVLDMARRDPHLVVAGEARSGRSTALVTIYDVIARDVPGAVFAVFSPRPSPVRELAEEDGVAHLATTSDEMGEVIADLSDRVGPRYLIIDDAEAVPAEIGDRLEPLLRDASQSGLHAFVVGRSADLSRRYDTWLRYLLSLRSGLLLMPTPDGGHVFDVRLPSSQIVMTPGRGFLCDRGEATFVQIAVSRRQEGATRPGSRSSAEGDR